MREILFRGKNKVTGEMIRGNLYQHGEQCFIMANNRNTEVLPETVGQYTGLTDVNDVKIFEGDICHFYGGAYYLGFWEYDLVREVKIDFDSFAFLENSENIEVIGNIYDNPELVKE